MKKYLTILLMLVFTSIQAETITYKTVGFAYKYINEYGVWTDWTQWYSSDMLMTIDFTNDIVKIYSPQTQTYAITKYVRNYTDNSGGKQVEFQFIDQDYDRGTMRLRVETNGNSQVYIEFSNIIWVYNVKRIQ